MFFILFSLLALIALYLYHVNTAMKRVPDLALQSSPSRWTVAEIQAIYKKVQESPRDITEFLPPNWILTHLLARGEDPSSLRILDLVSPSEEILAQGVDYTKTNITDELDVDAAFGKSWPESVCQRPLTVFHTAAIIRPSERLKCFLPFCANVNVNGTKNVLSAAKKSGATCFVSTSSGSVSLHQLNFWIMPWEKLPRSVMQVLSDDAEIPQHHDEFFGNYAVTKIEAERIVRSADDPATGFRTGCIRPANGIYGIGSDASMTITGAYLRNGGCPAPSSSKVNRPRGQSFVVTDPNPPIAYTHIFALMRTLSETPVSFPVLQPVVILLLSYVIEFYIYVQHAYLPWLLPKLTGDIVQIQPGLFSISDVFCIADDSRARKSPREGGLGYCAPITTLEGMCKQLVDWNAKA
ncbi:hypothetical protein N7528_007564 [Penicillium herquei]|nr:hypothetical protein N7528_007564 [Penicillium herquei]